MRRLVPVSLEPFRWYHRIERLSSQRHGRRSAWFLGFEKVRVRREGAFYLVGIAVTVYPGGGIAPQKDSSIHASSNRGDSLGGPWLRTDPRRKRKDDPDSVNVVNMAEQALSRCVRHQDCLEHPSIGEACYEQRRRARAVEHSRQMKERERRQWEERAQRLGTTRGRR